MTAVEQQYFVLLRSALWGTPIALEGEVDWDAIMRIAKHHGNDVLIGEVASRIDGNFAPAPDMLVDIQNAMRSNLYNQLQLKQILISAVQLLRKNDVEPVLLKGFGLAQLYPNPSLRQFGDIDLYIGLNDFHKSCTLLRSLPGGYNWGEEIDVGRHYNIEFGPYPMEVHRISADVDNASEQSVYAVIEQEGLVECPQRVCLDGFDVSIPSKEFAVFFTFYHAWHHFLTTGVGWRQLSDVAMVLHAYIGSSADMQSNKDMSPFDVEKLHSWLTIMHVMKPWQAFGWLLVEYLGLPKKEFPFYDVSCGRRARKLYGRIMAEGNFRRPNRFKHHKPKRQFGKKLHAFVGILVDFFQLASIFPDQAFHKMVNTFRSSFMKFFQKK